MPNKTSPDPNNRSLRKARPIERRSFLAAAPAAGLAAGAAAVIGSKESGPPAADPNRHLEYRETPHVQAYYRRARY